MASQDIIRSSGDSQTTYRWTNVTRNAAFPPRDGAGALVFKDRMWLIGGWNPGDKAYYPRTCTNDVWSSSDGTEWVIEKPNTYGLENFDPSRDWEGRHTAGYAVFHDQMWIVGGDPLQGHYQNDVWCSSDGRQWHCVTAGRDVPWGPRVLHHTLVFKDWIWIMGGQTLPQFAPEKDAFYDDIWRTADGVQWERVEPEGPHWQRRGMIGGNAVFQDHMWILGGGTYDTPDLPEPTVHNDVWSSPDGIHWERRVEHAPWSARQYHDVAVFDGKMWVLEGNSVRENARWHLLNDVWWSADGLRWFEVPDTPWAPRHAASVFVYDDALWVVAGCNMESDVWKLERVDIA
ncbi:MAG TPA: hypothetical protein HPP83_01480 [Candidatus Hydrogenedentes bacterium]|nr:hypothetical protein [Candidatus Hydrogenedentota bacterium]